MPVRKKDRPEEMIQVTIPKSRIRQPFPLRWGLASLALFALFAVATQIQFSRISADKLFDARMDTYQSDVEAYEAAEKSIEECITLIKVRETYRTIFTGISDLFVRTADLPVELFPTSGPARIYQEALKQEIDNLITQPVENGLPPRLLKDCPKLPENKPVKPER